MDAYELERSEREALTERWNAYNRIRSERDRDLMKFYRLTRKDMSDKWIEAMSFDAALEIVANDFAEYMDGGSLCDDYGSFMMWAYEKFEPEYYG